MFKWILNWMFIAAVFATAIPAAARDNGLEVGAVFTKSVSGGNDSEPDYISGGINLAYRFKVWSRVFVRPEFSFQAGRYPHDDYQGNTLVSKTCNVPLFTELGICGGIRLYRGLSFLTGPLFRHTMLGKDAFYRAYRNKISSYWTFALQIDADNLYIMFRYSQGMNHHSLLIGDYIPEDGERPISGPQNLSMRNNLSVSVGYRF